MAVEVSAIDRIWTEGYKKIMADEEQRRNQEIWVSEAAREIRKLPPEELLKREFLYIPNDIYMLHYFGAEIADYKYGVYREDQCSLYKRLAFPVRGFNNDVVALGGWANDSQWKYVYSPDTLWDKTKYFYITPEEFQKAIEDEYIIIVDGIFDSIALNSLGLHASSLMGSNLSNWHKYYLRFIKNIIVMPDNDNAGISLAKKIRKFRSDAIVISQGQYKDIDDYIKNKQTEKLVSLFNNLELLSVMNSVSLTKFENNKNNKVEKG